MTLCFGHGQVTFITTKLPEYIWVGRDDLIEQYLFLRSSHDGSGIGYFKSVRCYKDNEAKFKSIITGTALSRTQTAFNLCIDFAKTGDVALNYISIHGGAIPLRINFTVPNV